MTVTCISCQHFTLKPRTAEGEAHYRASDVAHARIGMGRCAKETLALHWEPAEQARNCDKHAPIAADQAAARRDWIRSNAT
ncbi:hypothetical protein KAF44_32390 [Cupriavidus necator]|nr:hypothetical protein KAF44_32390 [Cupriavidus necator]